MESQDLQVQQAHVVMQERMVLQVSKALLDHRVLMENEEHQVQEDQEGSRDYQELQVTQAHQAKMENQE